MKRKPNPSVAGLPCAICGKPAQSFSHIVHRGMGGDPQRLRTDGFPACGVNGQEGPSVCHGIETMRDEDGQLWYSPTVAQAHALRAKGVDCLYGPWNPAQYEGKTFDEMGESA